MTSSSSSKRSPHVGSRDSLPDSHALDSNWRVVTPGHFDPLRSPAMTEQDSHPAKKKRVGDQSLPLPPAAGQKPGHIPVQLQRRRVWRACECCRRKKIKCDGTEPVCSQCTSSGTQCTWLQTKDRAALSRHYVQELEARLLHMEDVFKQVAPVVELLGKTPNGAPVSTTTAEKAKEMGDGKHAPLTVPSALPVDKVVPAGSPTLSTASSSGKSPKHEEDISEPFGQLALDEHGHLRWIGGSSTMSLIQSFRALTSSPLSRISPMEEDPHAPGPSVNKLYFPASVFFGKVHALPGPEEVEYPERELADKLVDAFFSRFHFLLPVVDKLSFMAAYKHLMDNTADVNLARTQTAFVALVFAVFACAARIVDDDRLGDPAASDDGGIGMVYYERALILHYISHASIQIAHVQCFVLLSSFLCSVNCLPQAWLLVGQAVRMGQDLGLHRYSRHLTITPFDKETRRKVWWCVYSLDRMLALALGRPLGVEDSDCDAELPVDCDDEELPEYFSGAQMQRTQPSMMAGFIALIDLYKIAGRVCRQIYAIDKCKDNLEPEKMTELLTSVAILDKELNQWCEELPPAFKSHPVTDAQVSMGAVLCGHYHSILTTLHRNFLPIKQNSAFGPKSTAKALSSARACIRLAPSVKNVVPPSHHLAFFIQHLFSSAVILLLYAMHISDPKAAHAAMDEAQSCMEAVCAWEGRWPGARKCKELLADLTATAHKAINGETSMANRVEDAVQPRSPSSSTASPPLTPATARLIKGKPSRRKSHSNTSPRQSHHAIASGSSVRTGAARRNHSQKRGYGEIEQTHSQGAPSISFQHTFSGYPNDNGGYGQSSTAAIVPSPIPFLGPNQETNPETLMDSPIFDPLTASPGNQSLSPVHYDYTYGPSLSSQDATGSAWGSSGRSHSELYGAISQHLPFTNTTSYHTNAEASIDPNLMDYNTPSGPMLDFSHPSDTPPSSSFAASGLPFHGLDFIRNYTPGVFVEDGQDALWQSFDAGEFRYDPDLQFSLGDLPAEGTS